MKRSLSPLRFEFRVCGSTMLLALGLVFFAFTTPARIGAARTLNPLPANPQAPVDWERYSLTARNFSVALPAPPAMSTYEPSKNPLHRIVRLHVIGAYSEGVVFGIHIFERRESLDEFIKGFAPNSSSEFNRELKVTGATGKEYDSQDPTRKSIIQYFSTADYIYVFSALSQLPGNADVSMPRFFGSVRFGGDQTGRAILDGPGDQPVAASSAQSSSSPAPVLNSREVTRKAIVAIKPEPIYTEDARKKSVQGVVVLRAVFSSSGAVTGIRLISGLPHGLNEKAVAAARQIKFIPALKDGQFASQHIQLEYHFNLY